MAASPIPTATLHSNVGGQYNIRAFYLSQRETGKCMVVLAVGVLDMCPGTSLIGEGC
jgi:hypothetical protein